MKNRKIEVAGKGVRPTQDMVREALFSILAEKIPGSVFLDLYAGSGAVGLEALSRGAAYAAFVERERASIEVIKRNMAIVRDGDFSTFRMDARIFLKKQLEQNKYDIIFADPPYEKDPRRVLPDTAPCAVILELIESSGMLAEDGLFVMEQAGKQDFAEPDGWTLLRARKYGRAGIGIYRRS